MLDLALIFNDFFFSVPKHLLNIVLAIQET